MLNTLAMIKILNRTFYLVLHEVPRGVLSVVKQQKNEILTLRRAGIWRTYLTRQLSRKRLHDIRHSD